LESVRRSQCEPTVSATGPNRDISLKQRRCSARKVPLNGVDLAPLVKRVAMMKTELRRVFNSRIWPKYYENMALKTRIRQKRRRRWKRA
ncbi:hypothetical protein T12_9746, partial [Trichinella patagoniensis]